MAYAEGGTHFLTIDGDIRSITPAWIPNFLQPLVLGEAGFVSPSYQRSKFEGSTTNHFAYPVVLATTGRHVRQPIAGDFAFTRALIDAIMKHPVPAFAQYYGIDIYLTLTALMEGLKHEQIELDQKLHNPSFHKLEYMFPQIAATTLDLLRRVRLSRVSLQSDTGVGSNIIPTGTFTHKSAATIMRERAQSQLTSEAGAWDWVPNDVVQGSNTFSQGVMLSEEWVIILANWLEFGLKNPSVSTDLLAKKLLPFFVIRAVSFWFASEQMTAAETELEIRRQAQMLHIRLQAHI